jgi:3-hydroxyacyl-[acyl-carrier-protein] dehydratase
MLMDIQEILNYLPHRYPFLLIDRVLELEVDRSIVAQKNVTINEQFFVGHFPVKPVMPGVLIVEALAQAAAILAYHSRNKEEAKDILFYLGSIENARFKKVVVPGDQLRLEISVQRRRARVWKFGGVALVDGDVVCTAEMACAEGQVDS